MQMFPLVWNAKAQESEANQIGIGALPAFLDANNLVTKVKTNWYYFGRIRTNNRIADWESGYPFANTDANGFDSASKVLATPSQGASSAP